MNIARINRHVAESLHDLYESLIRHNFLVELEMWETNVEDREPKGIDDALKAGASIAIYDGGSVGAAIEEIKKAARAADPPKVERDLIDAKNHLADFEQHAGDHEWYNEEKNIDVLNTIKFSEPSYWALKIKPILKKHGMIKVVDELIFNHKAKKRGLIDPSITVESATAGTHSLTGSEPPQQSQSFAPEYGKSLSDIGNGERFATLYGDNVRYCKKWKKWLIWDDTRWAVDELGCIDQLAKKTVISIYNEISQIGGNSEAASAKREEIFTHAKRSESDSKINALLSRARSERNIPAKPEQFDKNRDLLCVENGILNLQTGELLPHNQSDFITKIAPVIYDTKAECPTFMRFIRRIMDGNEELITFIQRAAGYSLTGDVSERCMFILYGSGKNGKSTLVEVLSELLGNYSLRTPTETLMVKHGSTGVPNDVARLKGARFVSASETEEGQRLSESKIKDMTGGDTLTARYMHGEWFDFSAEFKIWLSTNHKPTIQGTDQAIWDRIRLIPFNVRIPEKEQNKHLLIQLKTELPGILNWAIQGCLAWRRDGLGMPAEVISAVSDYRCEMDIVGQFISECCIESAAVQVTSKALYTDYCEWCDKNGERSLSQNKFGRRIKERGFEDGRNGKARFWRGIGLIDDRISNSGDERYEKTGDDVTHLSEMTQSDAESSINGYKIPREEINRETASRCVTASQELTRVF